MRFYKREKVTQRAGYMSDGRAEEPTVTERKLREQQQQKALRR